jgi:hypothetical protein
MASSHLGRQQTRAHMTKKSVSSKRNKRNSQYENRSQPSEQAHILSTPSAGVPSPEFEDSGFFENEDTNTPRADYQDFILFNNQEYATSSKHHLFADANASTKGNHGSVHDGAPDEMVQIGRDVLHASQRTPPLHRAGFFDAVRDAVHQSVDDAVTVALINNYDGDSQSHSRSPPPTPYLRPLELWENTYQRHESIAYRYEQPPHVVRARNARATSVDLSAYRHH